MRTPLLRFKAKPASVDIRNVSPGLTLGLSCLLAVSVAGSCDSRSDKDVLFDPATNTTGQMGIAPGIERTDEDTNDDDIGGKNTSKGKGNKTSGPDLGEKNTGGHPDEKVTDCGESDYETQALPPNIMLVVDKSGSMYFDKWIDQGVSKTRWASLHSTATYLLKNFEKRVNFGLKLFPAADAQESSDKTIACKMDTGVEVECKANNAAAILKALPAATTPVAGDTPTVSGVSAAFEYLKKLDDKNPEAIILIIDGRTNCSQNNKELEQAAATAYKAGIPLYVVGIDLDAPTFASLEPVAVAGGTKQLYNSEDAAKLGKSLEGILNQISTCAIPLDPTPDYPDHVHVKLQDGTKVSWAGKGITDCEGAAKAGFADGWVYTQSSGPYRELMICGKSCSAFKKAPNVEVRYECPPPN